MMLVDERPATAPARPRRARGFLRSLLLLPFVFVMSLGLVLIGPSVGPAAAYASAPSPVTIGKTILNSPPGKVVKVVGGMTPWGRAIRLGMLAYSTRDAWWPVAQGIINNLGGTKQGTGASGCSVAAFGSAAGRTVTVGATWSGCTGAGGSEMKIYTTSGTCVANGITTTFVGNGVPINTGIVGSSGTGSYTIPAPCGVGQTLTSWIGRVDIAQAPAKGRSNTITVTAPWDGASTVQTTTVQCRRDDGTIVEISDTMTGYLDRVAVPSCADRVPGSIPWSGSIKAGPSAGAQDEVAGWTTDQAEYDKWRDCFGPSGLQCEIRVYVDGLPCTLDRVAACGNWTRLVDDPLTRDRVQCRFGSHVIDLEDCTDLEKSYRTETKPRAVTETDPDTKGPRVDPDPPPRTTPETCVGPQCVKAPPEVKTETDPNTANCFAEALSINPVDWVFVPVRCALIWAFKPKTSLQTRVETIKGTYTGKAPFSWFAGIAAIPAAVPGGACPDWRIKVAGLDKNVVCDSTYTGAIRTARPVLLVFMGALALWPLIRSTAYAAFPVIKPNPGVLR